MKDKLHAAIEELWRRRFSMASLSTEMWNVLGTVKADLHSEIDAIEEEAAKVE